MNRLPIRIGWRVASVGLLLAGLVSGVYLGQDRDVRQHGVSRNAGHVEVDDIQLLKERHNAHAAARAWQREAEGVAAERAAVEARTAAAKAKKIETRVIAKKKAAEEKKKAEQNGGTVEFTGPIPDSCDEYSGNREIGCALMLEAGFKIDQFPCLDKLWKHESGWNHRAENPNSGAYGIPQAYPGSKMSSVGSDWRSNPATQIKWGLGYIEGRYDTPCGAWSHFQDAGSY
ncbi:lytic transglycosylase domain-containing protein [Jidongwangia harbinensis]|uniref:aggregation-promoting factor C-terminal-like domain-containing protein n=1 Tax=Jidongwangia harbinensis TaxID=2878561 RepID=UPI001CDA16D1|nr:lytic transglycosylase domain-containing protein [Jidongwangia harbinensis]MCA2215526.1 lytic transglycosylase domain-containing protein [Jidongwangia harbinensis]